VLYAGYSWPGLIDFVSSLSEPNKVPYWHLSSFYFFYFAVYAVIAPYWSLYLKGMQFDPESIGLLTAILTGTRILAPNIWGGIADRTGRRLQVVQWGGFLGFFFALGLFVAASFYWMALVIAGFSFFWNATLSQFEVITLGYLKSDRHRYSRVRLWGSVGFILTVLGMGVLLDQISVLHLPWVLVGLLLMLWFSSLGYEEQGGPKRSVESSTFLTTLKQPHVIALLLVVFLVQVSHAPYYVFYSIYLEEHGYSRTLIGILWSMGVVAEVGIFMVMHRLFRLFSLRRLIVISLSLMALRWWMISQFVESLPLLFLAQVGHAFSFGVIHSCSIELIHRMFSSRDAGKGQASYNSVSFGAGAAFGAVISGFIWSGLGAETTYLMASAAALLAVVIALVGCRGAVYQ